MAFDLNEIGNLIADTLLDSLDLVLQDIADAILMEAIKNLDSGRWDGAQGIGAVDKGMLKRSGRVISNHLEKVVVFDAPHAAWIELGTKPHTPPFEPIFEWVKRNVDGEPISAKKIANSIIYVISKKGTPPRPFLRNAIDTVMNPEYILRIFKRRLDQLNRSI